MDYRSLMRQRHQGRKERSRLISAKEKAREMGVHVTTVYAKCKSGELFHVRVGWALLFPKQF